MPWMFTILDNVDTMAIIYSWKALCSSTARRASLEGKMTLPHLTSFNTLLPMMNTDQTTQSPQLGDLYHVSQGMFMDISLVLPIYNEGLDNSTAVKAFQPTHSTENPLIMYACPLGSGCTLPLEGTTASIYRHLRQHGLIHKHRDRAPCPWPGCSREMRWGNVARHVIESHLGVKAHCMFCGKGYARSKSFNAHMKACIGVASQIPDPNNC
ncbi:hypothetical protein F5141DRAFT_416064 [Pisolithus sp. B1]|nr:hypothetical protein F5141DRAFT_416064 [Pisolithus sp. B1]